MKVTLLAASALTAEAEDILYDLNPDLPPLLTNGDLLTEYAGRLCYASEERLGLQPDFVGKRTRAGHGSIIEHGYASFLLEGISRTCLAQLTRHRLAAYSVESQRYVDQSTAALVVPPSIQASPTAESIFAYVDHITKQAYQQLLDLGIPKEDARFILPAATATRLVMSANFREWRHILEVRLSPAAQWEIRALLGAILAQLVLVAPQVFGDLAV